jgi:hypothetical protein
MSERATEDKTLTQMIEEAVDKGATTAEEIHRAVADLPVSVLEKLELFGEVRGEVERIQDASIGGIYDLIRRVNHKVARLADEMLELRHANEA